MTLTHHVRERQKAEGVPRPGKQCILHAGFEDVWMGRRALTAGLPERQQQKRPQKERRTRSPVFQTRAEKPGKISCRNPFRGAQKDIVQRLGLARRFQKRLISINALSALPGPLSTHTVHSTGPRTAAPSELLESQPGAQPPSKGGRQRKS